MTAREPMTPEQRAIVMARLDRLATKIAELTADVDELGEKYRAADRAEDMFAERIRDTLTGGAR